jgi:hypothetical protein
MQDGVNVIAAAAGTVLAVRDGITDHTYNATSTPNVADTECGNGIILEHRDGWTSQYCHLKKGSLVMQVGEPVAKGAPLGQVGLSGQTEFPHVHFVLRKDGQAIDPFNPSTTSQSAQSCTQTSGRTLWDDTMTYRATGLLDVGITSDPPDYANIRAGSAHARSLPSDSPALVVYGFAFGSSQNDIMRLSLTGPAGIIFDTEATIEAPEDLYFQAVGQRAATVWPAGIYEAFVQIKREGRLMSEMLNTIEVTP